MIDGATDKVTGEWVLVHHVNQRVVLIFVLEIVTKLNVGNRILQRSGFAGVDNDGVVVGTRYWSHARLEIASKELVPALETIGIGICRVRAAEDLCEGVGCFWLQAVRVRHIQHGHEATIITEPLRKCQLRVSML